MKFSKEQLKKAANYIALNYFYPDVHNEHDLIAAKMEVAINFYQTLLHIKGDTKRKTMRLCKNNSDFADVIAQLEKQNYVFPKHLYYNLTVEKNNTGPKHHIRKPLAEKINLTSQHLLDYAQTLAGELEAVSEEEKDQYDYDSDIEESFESEIDSFEDSDEDDYDSDMEESFKLKTMITEEGAFMTSDNFEEREEIEFNPSNLIPSMRVQLSDKYFITFNNLLSLTPHVFLCGGAILDLIEKTKQSNDLDFVIPQVDTTQLKLLGYKKEYLKNNSYCIKSPYFVDVKMVPMETKYWMAKDVANRDFNICKLYCDADGFIYDITGQGLLDLKHRVLSMGGDETAKLAECPARIIRAMKYMQRGFKPDFELTSALSHFNYLNPKKAAHLYAVTRNLLKNSDQNAKQEILDNLRKYDLIKMLFGLGVNCTIDDLETEVASAPPAFYKQNLIGNSLLFQPVTPLGRFYSYNKENSEVPSGFMFP